MYPLCPWKYIEELIVLCKIVAADVFVMNDDNRKESKDNTLQKIFKSFQTSLLFLRVTGVLVLCFNICKNIDSLKRSLVGFGSKLHKHWGFDSLLDYCKKHKGKKKKKLWKIIPCCKAGDGCKAPKKITY